MAGGDTVMLILNNVFGFVALSLVILIYIACRKCLQDLTKEHNRLATQLNTHRVASMQLFVGLGKLMELMVANPGLKFTEKDSDRVIREMEK